jgi:hypothetical protein
VDPTYINVLNLGSNLSALHNDSTTDNANALQLLFDSVDGQGKTIYFPPGIYLIGQTVTVKSDTTVVGSRQGISLITTDASKTFMTNIRNYRRRRGVTTYHRNIFLAYLYFDGVYVDFRHQEHLYVSHCVFFLSKAPVGNNDFFVKFGYVANSLSESRNALDHSLFLRKLDHFGKAVRFHDTGSMKIKHNIFGLDLNHLDWLSGVGHSWSDAGGFWSTMKSKLLFLANRLNLATDQGCFNTSLNTGFTNKTRIEGNIFNGSPKSDWVRKHDHAIYLKGFDNMTFLENYVRGWPMDKSGCVKIRNGKTLVIAANYIDGTGFTLYSHLVARPPVLHKLYLGFKDVLIYKNLIVVREDLPDICNTTTGIWYYEPHRVPMSTDANDENIIYSKNQFKIEVNGNDMTGAKQQGEGKCINTSNGNQTQHHIYRDNEFYNSGRAVGIHSKWPGLSYAGDSPSANLIGKYVSTAVPNFNIPTYDTPVP